MPPINGARAWLGIGSMGIQPAEFAKTSTALLLAKYIGDLNLKQLNSKKVLIALVIIIIPMALILLQPDAGTFVVFTAFFALSCCACTVLFDFVIYVTQKNSL